MCLLLTRGLIFYASSTLQTQNSTGTREKIPDCLWTSSDRTIIICFVHSDACIRQSLTRIKLLPMSEACPSEGSEVEKARKMERGREKTQHRQQSWERSLHWYLTITCLLFLCHFHVNYREKPLRFICCVLLPFSLLPFTMSYTRLTGAVIPLLCRTLVYLTKRDLKSSVKYQIMCVTVYSEHSISHLWFIQHISHANQSALDYPTLLSFNHSLEADGVEGGSAHAFHALSGQQVR